MTVPSRSAVEGPAGARAELVAAGHDAERVDLRHVPPGHGCVSRSGDRDVGLAPADGAVAAPDRVHPRLGGAGEVRVGAAQREGLRDVEERRRPAGPRGRTAAARRRTRARRSGRISTLPSSSRASIATSVEVLRVGRLLVARAEGGCAPLLVVLEVRARSRGRPAPRAPSSARRGASSSAASAASRRTPWARDRGSPRRSGCAARGVVPLDLAHRAVALEQALPRLVGADARAACRARRR